MTLHIHQALYLLIAHKQSRTGINICIRVCVYLWKYSIYFTQLLHSNDTGSIWVNQTPNLWVPVKYIHDLLQILLLVIPQHFCISCRQKPNSFLNMESLCVLNSERVCFILTLQCTHSYRGLDFGLSHRSRFIKPFPALLVSYSNSWVDLNLSYKSQ